MSSLKAILGTMIAPSLLDWLLARRGYDGQLTPELKSSTAPDNLFQPVPNGHATHGRFDDRAQVKTAGFNAGVVRIVLATSAVAVLFALASVTTSVFWGRSSSRARLGYRRHGAALRRALD
jgi:hypothetical protein